MSKRKGQQEEVVTEKSHSYRLERKGLQVEGTLKAVGAVVPEELLQSELNE